VLERMPEAKQIWRHYKGHTYVIVGTGRIEATFVPAVIYRELEGGGLGDMWVRSFDDFLAYIDFGTGVQPRFERIR
jgi:hypothetical protein